MFLLKHYPAEKEGLPSVIALPRNHQPKSSRFCKALSFCFLAACESELSAQLENKKTETVVSVFGCGERGITFGDRLGEEPTTKNLTLLQSVVFLFSCSLRKRAFGAARKQKNRNCRFGFWLRRKRVRNLFKNPSVYKASRVLFWDRSTYRSTKF